MSYRDWFVGMKVVCVRNNVPRLRTQGILWSSRWPACVEHGKIFTIREIEAKFADLGVLAIRLREYHHPIDSRGWEVAFPAIAFRPLVARKTDISVFTALLHTNKQKEDA